MLADSREKARTTRLLIEQRAKAVAASPVTTLAPSRTRMMSGQFARTARDQELYGAFKSWVYVAVNAIAKRLGGQPWCAGEVEDSSPNPERHRPAARKSALPQRLKSVADDVELLSDHPSLDLLRRPNALQGKFEFLYMSAVSMLITGECYWVGGMVRGGRGEEDRVEIYAIPTTWVTPRHEGGLFTGYDLQLGDEKLENVSPESVARTYFPHPTELRSAYSPLQAILEAVRVDSHILRSQQQSFERGIFPNVVVSVGRERGPDGKLLDRRPVLTGDQRRQIVSAIREVYNESLNPGEPAIVDGLIESITKLSNSPAEMSWMQSGQEVKARVLQTYGVNPIMVGEIAGANRANAVVAESQFLSSAVNPLADAFSETATRWMGPWWDRPERLELWIAPGEPIDDELELSQWSTALSANAVSRDEYRAQILGLPADERPQRNRLMDLVGGVGAATQMLSQAGQGLIRAEQVSALLQVFFEMPAEQADAIAGVSAGPLPQLPEPENGQEDEEDDDMEDRVEELEASAAAWQERLELATRTVLVAAREQQLDHERRVAELMAQLRDGGH